MDTDSESDSDCKPNGYIVLGRTFHTTQSQIQTPILTANYRIDIGIMIKVRICICECKQAIIQCVLNFNLLNQSQIIVNFSSLLIAHRISTLGVLMKRSFVQQGLHRAQQLATNAGMKHMILKAVEQRQAGIVTPVLFECALLGDAEKLFCTLEDGDDVNPVVKYDYCSIILRIV